MKHLPTLKGKRNRFAFANAKKKCKKKEKINKIRMKQKYD